MKFAITLVIAVASFGSSVSAFADSQDTTVTTVPFDFVVGSKALPAGRYSISRIFADDSHGALLIRSADGSTAAMVLPTTSEAEIGNGALKLVFQHDGDTYFLNQVVAELSTYTFPKHRPNMRMAVSGFNGSASPSP